MIIFIRGSRGQLLSETKRGKPTRHIHLVFPPPMKPTGWEKGDMEYLLFRNGFYCYLISILGEAKATYKSAAVDI